VYSLFVFLDSRKRTRGGNVTSALKRVVVIGGVILSIAISARATNSAEQVIFSTPGFAMQLSGNQFATSTGFGFWVWCAAEAAANSHRPIHRTSARSRTWIPIRWGQTIAFRSIVCFRARSAAEPAQRL
jgi:hypothetical protein